METVHAIYENGVFRPTAPVDLPDRCEVEFTPSLLKSPADEPSSAKIYEILSRSYETGESDTAARHNEHQP
jgi:predicted DNA-binding antitoxin AbrB/MazE fold protein